MGLGVLSLFALAGIDKVSGQSDAWTHDGGSQYRSNAIEVTFDALSTGPHISYVHVDPDEDAVSEVEGFFLSSALVTSSANGNSVVMFEDVTCKVLLFEDPFSFSRGGTFRTWLPKASWSPVTGGAPPEMTVNECEPAGMVLDKNDVAYLLDRNNVGGFV